MRIAELTAFEIHLPLKRQIKHASATRDSSDNLLVRCRLEDGTEGWGEGVPRDYVTGETCEGAFRQLEATPLAEQLDADCRDWQQVIALCERFQPAADRKDPRGCFGNALRCAVELSLLDAFGRHFGEPLSRVTEVFEPAVEVRRRSPRVRYSGAITAEGRRGEAVSALKMRLYGFAQCKIKVGVRGADDRLRLKRIRRLLGRRIDIRLDANEAWDAGELVERVEPLLPYGISCLEQPVPHEQAGSLAALRRKLPVPIMLDESLTSLADAETAIRQGTCELFNIRLSKCGGFLNSLRLAALAHRHGLGYQLGCHPGESGVLSAAGRHFAASVGGIRYLEGSYDRHVLKKLLTREDLTFRYGGWAEALSGPGLGVTIDPEALAKLKTRELEIPLLGAAAGRSLLR
jgi:muconate cycloisomerase